MSDIKLKPCPFCGGEAKINIHRFVGLSNSYGVECKECMTQSNQFFGTVKAATEAWNRRANENDT